MFLIVLRHGELDGKGNLNPLGEDQIRAAATALAHSGYTPDLIVTSTPARARQSTDILKTIFNTAAPVREFNLLDLSTDTFDIHSFLGTIPAGLKTVILSGHAETIEGFAHHLLTPEDCEKLFRALPQDRFMRHGEDGPSQMWLMPRKGDALILSADDTGPDRFAAARWRLHGYMADGRVLEPAPLPASAPIGRKIDTGMLDPILVYEPAMPQPE
jgi:phosphohistidine phosphatase SixA